jgi:hypothetical protein
MLNVAAGLGFAGFVLLALAVAAAPRGSPRGKALVHALLLYSVGISFGAGLTQRDAWPFSAWPLVAGVLPESVTHPRLVAVDERGVEHAVDYRAWQPLGFDELMAWLDRELLRLPPASRDRAGAYLLGRAEQARQRARAGLDPGYFGRVFGPAQAPYFLLHPRTWTAPDTVPAQPFVRLRLYHERWSPRERQRRGAPPGRLLVFEYPPP